jgi:hypothetical protein
LLLLARGGLPAFVSELPAMQTVASGGARLRRRRAAAARRRCAAVVPGAQRPVPA